TVTLTQRTDLLRFLKQACSSSPLLSQQSPPISTSSSIPVPQSKCQIYVLGNPSADLDSIISAIIYSYFATRVVSSASTDASSSPSSSRNGGKEKSILRQYIPLIYLPDVHAGKELARLRPEFVTALRLAVGWDRRGRGGGGGGGGGGGVTDSWEDQKVDDEELGRCVLTTADLKETLMVSWAGPRKGREKEMTDKRNDEDTISQNENNSSNPSEEQKSLNVMMVDWNVMPKVPPNGDVRVIEGLSDALPGLHLSIVGCIDHHEDEAFVSRNIPLHPMDPCCIETGIGSCTSLVIRELRAAGLWTDESSSSSYTTTFGMETLTNSSNDPLLRDSKDLSSFHEAQVAKLAMAAILVDTANMTAKGKVSAVDTAAVQFLETKIQAGISAHFRDAKPKCPGSSSGKGNLDWDRQAFYDEIAKAKENSVDNLTVLEVLGRDYKEWTDTLVSKPSASSSGDPTVKFGICCMVKPLSWLVEKCIQESKAATDKPTTKTLLKYLSLFVRQRDIDLVAIMTAFRTEPTREFRRELLIYVLNRGCVPATERFETAAVGELGLEEGIWTSTDADADWIRDPPLSTRAGANGEDEGCYMRVWRQKDVSKSRKQVAPLLRSTLNGGRL
ncbi:hypothetical protein ACO22_08133, partial [Paracoccidioides brasiliensis]